MAYNIKAAIRAAKNMQYEPIEVKVREATNNDPWGQSTSVMADIARSTHHHDEYSLLFKMVWKRLNDHEHVMHVQKALILIDFLLRKRRRALHQRRQAQEQRHLGAAEVQAVRPEQQRRGRGGAR